MKNRLVKIKKRIVLWVTLLILVLGIVGILMQNRMRKLLNDYIENQVTRQAGVLADLCEEEFLLRLKEMENIASYIEKYEEIEQIVSYMELSPDKESTGILQLDGSAVFGEPINFSKFSGIQKSFRGQSAVSYQENLGLLLTVPVYRNENIKYVYYKFYEEALLAEEFGLTCYNSDGRILIADRNAQIIIPFEDWSEEDLSFFEDKNTINVFGEISDRLNVATEAAVFCKNSFGKNFVFVAEMMQTDMYLIGVVEENVVAEGVSYIIALVLWVFGLLLLLFVIVIIYLFAAEEKAQESEELRRAKALADTANKAKTDFLANMSHEIRTPINAVMGMNEMILRECTDEQIKEYAFHIQGASKTLLSLINDILDLSKIEAGKMEIINEPYNLSSVLNDVVNMIQIKAEQKKLQFKVEVDEDIPDKLNGDEVRIKQVLVNLLSNAVKYTKEGEVTLKIEKNDIAENVIGLVIKVLDTGIGIHKDDMDKLFQNFERLDHKENHSVEGTGLGLPITSKMVKLMNGDMDVESVYGEGSVFSVYLPQQIVEEEKIGNFTKKYQEYIRSINTYHQSFTAPQANILVVDDNDVNLFVVEKLLSKTLIQITKCSSGKRCLELVKEKYFDVILLDHMMPEMDGMETFKRLKAMEEQKCQNTPVIALTANAILGAREMYFAEGFQDYLSKPIESDKLEELLIKYLPKEKIRVMDDKPKNDVEKETVKSEDTERKEISKQEENSEADVKQKKEKVLDIAIGLQYSAGMEEMYREFLKMYCESHEEKKTQIEGYYEAKDWENYAIKVHALKSTSLTVGGKELSEMAAALEKAGKEC